VAFGKRSQQSDEETTRNVHEERAPGETPGRGVMEDESAELVTRSGAKETTETNDEELFHVEGPNRIEDRTQYSREQSSAWQGPTGPSCDVTQYPCDAGIGRSC
jgi:hypothetical protein